MSRVGKLPVKVDPSVKVQILNNQITVQGKGGKLSTEIPEGILVESSSDEIVVTPAKNLSSKRRGLWGTTRATIQNMVHGVNQGFKKELDIVGVGYRAAVKGKVLNLNLGFSHPVDFPIPEGIEIQAKGTHITVSGADRVLVGQTAAKIRAYREPEPYQGKGVKYSDERIIRKQGKAAGGK